MIADAIFNDSENRMLSYTDVPLVGLAPDSRRKERVLDLNEPARARMPQLLRMRKNRTSMSLPWPRYQYLMITIVYSDLECTSARHSRSRHGRIIQILR